MKFGQVTNPTIVDFSLPNTPLRTLELLKNSNVDNKPLAIHIGAARWGKAELKGFYPRGTKEELPYYSSQFNTIELNSTFYHSPTKHQVETWRLKSNEHFKFCPKIPQSISHYSRLNNTADKVLEFVDAVAFFEEKLGMGFLQLPENFSPKDFERLVNFLRHFPEGFPLSVEVRHLDWYTPSILERLNQLLVETKKTHTIVDTPGRRDLVHMHLTSPSAFIRFVSAKHDLDYQRLDNWIQKIVEWKNAGLQDLYFFIHQEVSVEAPLLATYFVTNLNKALNTQVKVPQKAIEVTSKMQQNLTLF